MPAKKGGKKKKQNPLESEVKPMPSLVFNNIRMTNELQSGSEKITENKPESKESIREKFIQEQLSRRNKMTYWFYASMIVILGAIIFFWGYSLWSNFTSINWGKTTENKLMEKTTTDLNQAFQTGPQNELQNQLTKLQIKELLAEALKKQTATSSTGTTTTSTVITNTTTIATTTQN